MPVYFNTREAVDQWIVQIKREGFDVGEIFIVKSPDGKYWLNPNVYYSTELGIIATADNCRLCKKALWRECSFKYGTEYYCADCYATFRKLNPLFL